MTDQPNDALKALAEAAFDLPVAEETSPPIGADEYRAKQAAERMARLRAARLAEEAGCGEPYLDGLQILVAKRSSKMTIRGYARVSTQDQHLRGQLAAPKKPQEPLDLPREGERRPG